MFPFEVGAGCDRVAPFLQKSQDTQCIDNKRKTESEFLIYWPNGYVLRFGSETVIHSAHFGLESGMVFEETIYWSV